MNCLQYLSAKWRGDETAFAAASITESELLHYVAGKQVALVGNARALAEQGYGAEIDSADVVIRINGAPMPSARSHGTRTDWLALAVRLSPAEFDRLGQPRLLWLSPKFKRISWNILRAPGFFRYPPARYQRLRDELGTGPTTGIMMIDLLATSRMAGLRLYGFDFFASLSLSGPRTKADVGHNFDGEATFVAELSANDPRIVHRR